MMDTPTDAIGILDTHYSRELGCHPGELRAGGLLVVASRNRELRFAKGYPLPVFALDAGEGVVVSVEARLLDQATEAAAGISARCLSQDVCDAFDRLLRSKTAEAEWFQGVRLYLEASAFVESDTAEVREVSADNERASKLRERWGGPVFARIIEGRAVSWAAVKTLSDAVWDISIETLPDHRGHGYAKSAASAALRHVFDCGRLAAWATDRTNTASLRIAESLGFRHYALEMGCFVRCPHPSDDRQMGDT